MYNYARVLCHYAALVSKFTDAWGEGDVECVLRCWKIFMLHFQVRSCITLSGLSSATDLELPGACL